MFAMPAAIPSLSNTVSLNGSKSLSLSLIGDDLAPKSVSGSPSPFYFTISRDTTLPLPQFDILESTDQEYINNNNSSNAMHTKANILELNGFLIPKNNVSIHYHIRPDCQNESVESVKSVGYFAALKFGDNAHLNSTYQSFDVWNVFCPHGNFVLKLFLILLLSNNKF